jgi:hypothetical protein
VEETREVEEDVAVGDAEELKLHRAERSLFEFAFRRKNLQWLLYFSCRKS